MDVPKSTWPLPPGWYIEYSNLGASRKHNPFAKIFYQLNFLFYMYITYYEYMDNFVNMHITAYSGSCFPRFKLTIMQIKKTSNPISTWNISAENWMGIFALTRLLQKTPPSLKSIWTKKVMITFYLWIKVAYNSISSLNIIAENLMRIFVLTMLLLS